MDIYTIMLNFDAFLQAHNRGCFVKFAIIQKRPLSSHLEQVSVFPHAVLIKLHQLDPEDECPSKKEHKSSVRDVIPG